MSFFSELKRRNVVRMALLYIVAGWVLLQIADVLFDPLGLPNWSFRFVLGLLLLGFPFALIFSWVFELTPDGLKRESGGDPATSVTRQTGHKMNIVIIVLLVIAIAGVVLDRVTPESDGAAAPVSVSTATNESARAPVADTEPDNSIAVLPFVNMSGDPDNEYFSDGLTEELLNTLVRVGGLKVTGRTSSFAFKGDSRDLREIARMLNVANVLEGSVRKAGNRVRITAQLVKASDGYHVWSDTFDRELDDIFAVQEEIANQVTDALHITLLGDEPAVNSSRDPKAYEEYLRGMYVFQTNPDGEEELDEAEQHFQRALAIDPNYVEALYGMFEVCDRRNRNGLGDGTFQTSLEEMRHYAKALQSSAPDSELTLSALARLAQLDYDHSLALDYLARALSKHPGNADLLAAYGTTLSTTGRLTKAISAIEAAEELDPLSLEVMRWKSYISYRAGDCARAEQVMQRAMDIDPGVGRFRFYLAMCLFETEGDLERALPLAEAEPLTFAHNTALAIFYDELGEREKAQEMMDHMQAAYGDTAAYQYAQVYAQWGDREKALEWLDAALDVRDPGLLQMGKDRSFSELRDDAQFQDILQRAGLR